MQRMDLRRNAHNTGSKEVHNHHQRHYLEDEEEVIGIEEESSVGRVMVEKSKAGATQSNASLPGYSVHRTLSKIFQTIPNVDRDTNVFDLVRSLCVAWVCAFHTWFLQLVGTRLPDHPSEFTRSTGGYWINGHMSVDGFLTISGFLMIVSLLKELEKNGTVDMPTFLSKRLLRVMPSLCCVVLCFLLFVPMDVKVYQIYFFASNTFLDRGLNPASCSVYNGRSAYTHTLNEREACDMWSVMGTLLMWCNYLPMDQQCVGWSWYVSLQIHFYILVMLMTLVLARLPNRSSTRLNLAWAMLATFTLTRLITIAGVRVGHSQFGRVWNTTFIDNVYQPTHSRVAPAFIGVILGMHYHEFKTKLSGEKYLPWTPRSWVLTALAWVGTLLPIVRTPHSVARSIAECNRASNEFCIIDATDPTLLLGLSLFRIIFAASLAWLCWIALTHQLHGYWRNFMAWRIWHILAKLGYGVYLVNPLIVVGGYALYLPKVWETSIIMLLIYTVHTVVMSCIVALVLHVFIEQPFMQLRTWLGLDHPAKFKVFRSKR